MSKIELPAVTGSNNTSRINDNFQKIEDALNQEVLYRKGYTGEPNEMETNLDMNGKQILNATTGTSDRSLVTKGYVDQEISEERAYVDQQLAEVDNSLSTKYDKTGGVLSGDVLMQGHKIKGLNFATENSEPVTLGQVLDIDSGTGLQASITAFEALRRSYAEAGYNLVGGSFEVGGTVTTSTDVLLYEAEGKACSWGGSLPKTVSPGSAPQNTGGIGVSAWTDRSDYATNATSVNAAIFVSLQAAVDYASSTGKKLIVDGDWTVPTLKLTKWGHDKPWYVEFNGKITVTTRLDFMGMDACHIRGGVFICPAIYIQGVRHSSFSEMDLRGKIYIGKWDGSPAGASWSLYWNNFISVQFDAIYVRTTLTSCGINSNTFDTCVFRDNQSAGQLWHIDVPGGQTDPVMTSNTFVGCDWSYAPAWNFAYDYGYSFSATVIGGYLDTSTPWLKPGSYGGVLMDVVGLRNPSGERLESRTTSAIKMTTGGARPSKSLPVGAVSMVKNPPKTISGPGLFNMVNAPFDGDYTLTIILKSQVGVTNYGIGTIYNDTTGASRAFVTKAGHNSVTFSANAGDAIRVAWGITTGQPTIVVEEFSMTPGAGIYSAVKRAVAEPYEYDSGLLTITTTPTIALTITPPSYRLTSREVLITTLDPDGGGGGLAGGGERIKASLITSSGSSISSATLQEYARALVNGTGSSSDDPPPVVVTTSISGLAVNILLSVASGTVNARVRATYDDSLL